MSPNRTLDQFAVPAMATLASTRSPKVRTQRSCLKKIKGTPGGSFITCVRIARELAVNEVIREAAGHGFAVAFVAGHNARHHLEPSFPHAAVLLPKGFERRVARSTVAITTAVGAAPKEHRRKP